MTAGKKTAQSGLTAEGRLALALILSLLIHAGGYGTYKLGQKMGWHGIPMPAWLKKMSLAKLLPLPEPKILKELQKPPEPQRELPLRFIEVDPTIAEKEPPKDAKYYSALNSKAANPEVGNDASKPKIDGKQDKVASTMDVLKPEPPKPAPPEPPAPVAKKQEEVKPQQAAPKSSQAPGDLAMARPAPTPKPDPGKAESKTGDAKETKPERVRRLSELPDKPAPALASDRMKQDGGVRNFKVVSSENAIASPFGVYDRGIVAAIQREWFSLLDQQKGVVPTGKVVINFRLKFDGTISDVQVVENEVGALFGYVCEGAIRHPAPYGPWPSDLRRLMNSDYRDVCFTFYYY